MTTRSRSSIPVSQATTFHEDAELLEQTECVRALLARPLITVHDNADVFRKIRRHSKYLREWFEAEAGWRLVVDGECARLHKSPERLADATRGAVDPQNDNGFTRKRYVLLCLSLAVLERGGRQTLLGRLADDVTLLATTDPALADSGLMFDPESREYRCDLAAVARLLLHWGVLRRDHGHEDGYVNQSEDVLYTIRRAILGQILSVERGPSTLVDVPPEKRISAIRAENAPESDEGRRRRLRHALTRRLIDDPVVYVDELQPEVYAYFQSQRNRTVKTLQDATGLLVEIRREAVALVDPCGELTDHPMPEEGTRGHVALLLAEGLAKRLREDAEVVVTDAEMEALLAEYATVHAGHWRKAMSEAEGIRTLLHQVLAIFVSLGLLRREADGRNRPLSAIGRYGLAAPVIVGSSNAESP